MNQETTKFGSSARITGSPINPSTPCKMRVEVRLYPERSMDPALCVHVATDAEYSTGHSILLNKDEAAALIKTLSEYLNHMTYLENIRGGKAEA